MTDRALPRGARVTPARRSLSRLDRFLRGRVLARLAGLRHGTLDIADADGVHRVGAAPLPGTDVPRLDVEDGAFWTAAALGGNLGFAESYLRGEWRADDLPAVLRFFARHVARDGGDGWSSSRLAGILARLVHATRANTRSGSRRNIREHYDLGNDFYALFLDDTMTYSCAYFERPDATLREASLAKLELVCRKAGLAPGMHVLEIGTGWGSFALHAARHHGCRVTTTTISEAQRAEATRRVRAAGLADRIRILGADYRDLTGRYDRLVSLEMVEAVGAERLGTYFRKCADLLAPDGAMVLQAITLPDRDWDAYRRSPDFIQRHVFPGSCVPSPGALTRAIAARTDLRLVDVQSLGPHYAETLRRWRAAFLARRDEARAQGRTERFLRLWDFYLAYCEAGFAEGYVDDLQLLLAKPAWAGVRPRDAVPAAGEEVLA